MGSFNISCAVSRLPINEGEKVVCFFLGEAPYGRYDFQFRSWSKWQLISLPMFTKMDDYGMTSHWRDDEGGKESVKWFKTLNADSRMAFTLFRPFVHLVGEGGHHADETCWYRAMGHDSTTKHAVFGSPQSGVRFQPFIVRRDVYDWMMARGCTLELAWQQRMTERIKASFNLLKTGLGGGWGFNDQEIFGSAFQSIICDVWSGKAAAAQKARSVRLLQDAVKFACVMTELNQPFEPNLTALQCGWGRKDDLEPLFAFNRFKVELTERKLKEMSRD